jgi:hypothetical protein
MNETSKQMANPIDTRTKRPLISASYELSSIFYLNIQNPHLEQFPLVNPKIWNQSIIHVLEYERSTVSQGWTTTLSRVDLFTL